MIKYLVSFWLCVTAALTMSAIDLVDTDLSHEGKTGLKDLCRIINSNNVLLEGNGVILNNNGASITNLNAGYLTAGNAPLARLTNAAGSLGPSIGGNVPIAAITNAAGSVGPSIGGNVPAAAITNALATSGPQIGGNIPQAAITNAAATLGPYIGGNIPQAAMTNVLVLYVPLTSLTNAVAPLTTNDCLEGTGGVTNRIIFNAYGVKISSTQL